MDDKQLLKNMIEKDNLSSVLDLIREICEEKYQKMAAVKIQEIIEFLEFSETFDEYAEAYKNLS